MKHVFKIEAAKPEDLPEIARLAREIWLVCYKDVISMEQINYMLNWMYGAETMAKELSQNICYDKLILDGKMIGYTSYGPSEKPEKMKLHKIYIHHDFQKKGYGSATLKYVFERANEKGFSSVVLNVNKNNTNAVAAYKKNGFVIAETCKLDVGNGFYMDDYILEKKLYLNP
jgi:ribosomal protein S18 acetylase RimI-like enzyme